jgi:hypothetical protein
MMSTLPLLALLFFILPIVSDSAVTEDAIPVGKLLPPLRQLKYSLDKRIKIHISYFQNIFVIYLKYKK